MIEPSKGFYVVIEGAQGTGKTTRSDLLAKPAHWLEPYAVEIIWSIFRAQLVAQAFKCLTDNLLSNEYQNRGLLYSDCLMTTSN